MTGKGLASWEGGDPARPDWPLCLADIWIENWSLRICYWSLKLQMTEFVMGFIGRLLADASPLMGFNGHDSSGGKGTARPTLEESYLLICIVIVAGCARKEADGKAKDWSNSVAVPWQRLDSGFDVDADGGALSGKSNGRGGGRRGRFPGLERDERGAGISGQEQPTIGMFPARNHLQKRGSRGKSLHRISAAIPAMRFRFFGRGTRGNFILT